MEVALLSEELFKANSPVRDDTMITEFIPYIILAQRIYIKKMLGIPLYEELQTQIKAADAAPEGAPNPISIENRALLTEIAPALSLYAVYQGLPYQWAQIVNKGVLLHTAENGKSVDMKDLAVMRRIIRDDANTLLEQVKEYMRDCGLYSSWRPETPCCGETKPSKPQKSGIWIPRSKRGCR